jgi:AcrR family transcriptional regulator
MNDGSPPVLPDTVRRPPTAGATVQKERIRFAAVQLFTRQGFAGTSMKQLAQALQTVPANLYNYFPNKEAILLDVLEHQLLAMRERDLAILARDAEPAELLRCLVRDLVVNDLSDPLAAFVGIQGVRGLSDENLTYVSGLMGEIRASWAGLISRGVRQGVFAVADPKLVALSILTLCSSVSTWYRPGGEYTAAYVADSIAEMALRMAASS